MAQITIDSDWMRVAAESTDTMFREIYGVGSAAYQVWGTDGASAGGWMFLASDQFPEDIPATKLNVSGVAAATYGGEEVVAQLTIDAAGFITTAADVAFSLEILDDLSDTLVTTPSARDILEYSGSQWVNVVQDSTILATTTASNDATVEITGDWTSYSKLELLIFGVSPSVDDSYLNCRVSTDTGSTWLETDEYSFMSNGYSGTEEYGGNILTDRFILSTVAAGDSYPNTDQEDAFTSIAIYGNNSANARVSVKWFSLHVDSSSSANLRNREGSGVVDTTDAVSGIQIYFDAGNVVNGYFVLKGYRS